MTKRAGFLVSGEGRLMEAVARASRSGLLKLSIGCALVNHTNAPAIKRAESLGIPCEVLETEGVERPIYSKKAADIFLAHEVDFIFSTFDRLLAPGFTKVFKEKALNLHLSLLPSFEGAGPRRRMLEKGVRIGGATIHFIDDSIDRGAIISQMAFPIPEGTELSGLFEIYGKMLTPFVLNTLDFFIRDKITVKNGAVTIEGAGYGSMPFVPELQEKFKDTNA